MCKGFEFVFCYEDEPVKAGSFLFYGLHIDMFMV